MFNTVSFILLIAWLTLVELNILPSIIGETGLVLGGNFGVSIFSGFVTVLVVLDTMSNAEGVLEVVASSDVVSFTFLLEGGSFFGDSALGGDFVRLGETEGFLATLASLTLLSLV